MDFSSYKFIKFERDGKILRMTLNRPEQMNAISPEMETELAQFFSKVPYDKETSVIVITGAGKAFSAGGDIPGFQRHIDDPEIFAGALISGKQLISAMLDCRKPIIAKVNGHAVGLGATIALFCDMVFAADHVKLGDPHVLVSLAAGDGGAAIWPQLVGFARAKQYLLTGDLIAAPEAERIGLINQAVPADQLDALVETYAKKLANGATKAIEYTKVAVNLGLKQVVNTILDASLSMEFLTAYTQDHQEAVNAFNEKRKPAFKGK